MKKAFNRVLLATAAALAVPDIAFAQEADEAAQADPGTWRISTGVNYSQGDYGDTQDTKVVSVPVALKYRRGGFSVRVSVPYVHIDGPGSLLDTPQGRDAGFGDDTGFDDSAGRSDNSGSGNSGSGNSGSGSSGSSNSGSGNSGSGNSGSGNSGSGDSGSGSSGSGSGGSGGSNSGGSDDAPTTGGNVSGGNTGTGLPGTTGNRRGGLGDIAVTLAYSLDFGNATYFDVSSRIKLPTASKAKRLGTGKVDVTMGGDLVKDVGEATIYLGARHRFLGKPAGSTLRNTWGFGGGASYRLSDGTVVGADYDWQQSVVAGNSPSSEVTGWVNVGVTPKLRLQVFGSTGLNRGSADFAGGLSLSYRLN
ncbi:hypothetical protein HGI47_03930 [Novosphingobium sp. ERN07]|uniref:hypothetical protein n=1 Tax=Novosphingobium sp. ERN07 TaxID=2726187 RepID=UPI0014567C19|nr:hypothetical protein [Novosphingobium sp. ERN07]NLR70025.1 hypothetical protein [Novosphingobium sp. ERN07]